MKINSQTSILRRWQIVVMVVIALMAAIIAGRLVAQNQFRIIMLVVLLLPATILLTAKTRIGLLLLIISAFSIEYLVRIGLLPSVGTWAIDGLVGILFVNTILTKSLSVRVLRQTEFRLLLVWIVLIILSAIINLSSPIQIILGTHTYIRFPLLFYCLIEIDWPNKFIKQCLVLIAILYWLQLPFTIGQRLSGLRSDAVSGTFSSSGTVGLIGFGFFAALAAYSAQTKRKAYFLIGITILAIPALAAARAFIWFIPLVTVYVMWRLKGYQSRWQLVILIFGLGALFLAWDKLQGSTAYGNLTAAQALSNPSIVISELLQSPVEGTQGASIGRIAGLKLAWDQISQSGSSTLFGFGPAVAQGSRFELISGHLFEILALAGSRASQLSRSLLEWGMLGTLAYLSVYLIIGLRSEQLYRREMDPFWKSIAFGHVVFSAIMIGLLVYTSTWSATGPSFVYWFVSGAIYRRSQNVKLLNEMMENRRVH